MNKFLCCLFFISFAIQANDECSNIQLSDQVFSCSKKAYENSDAQLNNTYKKIITIITEEYKNQPNLKSEFIEKIKISQRAWISFRDANCAVYSFQIDSKSQAYETSIYSCKDDMTRKRTVELNSILAQQITF